MSEKERSQADIEFSVMRKTRRLIEGLQSPESRTRVLHYLVSVAEEDNQRQRAMRTAVLSGPNGPNGPNVPFDTQRPEGLDGF